jgi:hypothetical protein
MPISDLPMSVTEKKPSKRIGRSVLAVVAGFVATVILSYGVDAILVATGVMPKGGKLPLHGSELLVAFILAYRALFSVAGCYVAARLAPNHPMRHALILGTLGMLGGAAGAMAMQGAAPGWYSWGIVALALPMAWLGGKLYKIGAKAQ